MKWFLILLASLVIWLAKTLGYSAEEVLEIAENTEDRLSNQESVESSTGEKLDDIIRLQKQILEEMSIEHEPRTWKR